MQVLDKALEDHHVVMAPPVLTELLSDPKLPAAVVQYLSEIPPIEIQSGYWQRAGVLRAKVVAKRRKARLGDALIAQSCLDCGVPLLTRDRDFLAFADSARLDLVMGAQYDLRPGSRFSRRRSRESPDPVRHDAGLGFLHQEERTDTKSRARRSLV